MTTLPAHIQSAINLLSDYVQDGALVITHTAAIQHTDIPITIDGETFTLADVALNADKMIGLYADRCADLAHEYEEREQAERHNEALKSLVYAYANHLPGCATNWTVRKTAAPMPSCDCGYTDTIEAINTSPASTPYARIIALGRAALAYERARAERCALPPGADEATLRRTARAVYETRRAYLEQLAEAKGAE